MNKNYKYEYNVKIIKLKNLFTSWDPKFSRWRADFSPEADTKVSLKVTELNQTSFNIPANQQTYNLDSFASC